MRFIRLFHYLRAALAAGLVTAVLTPAPASALAVAGGATIRNAGTGTHQVKLGPVNQQTCFLSGLFGSFVGNPAFFPHPNATVEARAEVVNIGGFWVLRTKGGVGPGVGASAICIFATANKVELSQTDNLTSDTQPATPNRHCFLSTVWATSGLSGNVPGSGETNLTLTKTSGPNPVFTFAGSSLHNFGGDLGFGGATARCVDYVENGSWNFTLPGPTNAANSATKTLVLRNSFPNGTPIPVAGVGCFLTAISNRWASPSPDPLGLLDGVFLTGDPKISKNWELTASNGRQGSVHCSG